MKISDFDIYHLPPLMGMFVDYIENECERLLQESPQFTELQREDHELLDEYPFLNMITDSIGFELCRDRSLSEILFSGRRYKLLETIADVFIRNSTCDGDHRVIEVRLSKTWSLYRRRNYVNLL